MPVSADHRRRQALGSRVDREAEQHQLQHRNADDHPEGQAVAPQLDEFLDDDPAQREGESAAGHTRRRPRSSGSMNTSSSPGSIFSASDAAAVAHADHPGDEVEVLADGQVFPEREALRHVAEHLAS